MNSIPEEFIAEMLESTRQDKINEQGKYEPSERFGGGKTGTILRTPPKGKFKRPGGPRRKMGEVLGTGSAATGGPQAKGKVFTPEHTEQAEYIASIVELTKAHRKDEAKGDAAERRSARNQALSYKRWEDRKKPENVAARKKTADILAADAAEKAAKKKEELKKHLQQVASEG